MSFCGLSVFGGDIICRVWGMGGGEHVIFGFGNCAARFKLAEVSREQGFSLGIPIHPRATVAAEVTVGGGR